MKVCVIGGGAGLQEHCRLILSELGASQWEVMTGEPVSEPVQADKYVWDFVPGEGTAFPNPEIAKRTLFAVHPKDLDLFRTALGNARASILLKPVSSAALRPFLEQTVRQSDGNTRAADAENEQNQTDDLLERLLQANLRLSEHDPTTER